MVPLRTFNIHGTSLYTKGSLDYPKNDEPEKVFIFKSIKKKLLCNEKLLSMFKVLNGTINTSK